jgi:hypothetical protein
MITGDGLITSSVIHGGSGMNQVKSFGEINCGTAQLGDQRRTKFNFKICRIQICRSTVATRQGNAQSHNEPHCQAALTSSPA